MDSARNDFIEFFYDNKDDNIRILAAMAQSSSRNVDPDLVAILGDILSAHPKDILMRGLLCILGIEDEEERLKLITRVSPNGQLLLRLRNSIPQKYPACYVTQKYPEAKGCKYCRNPHTFGTTIYLANCKKHTLCRAHKDLTCNCQSRPILDLDGVRDENIEFVETPETERIAIAFVVIGGVETQVLASQYHQRLAANRERGDGKRNKHVKWEDNEKEHGDKDKKEDKDKDENEDKGKGKDENEDKDKGKDENEDKDKGKDENEDKDKGKDEDINDVLENEISQFENLKIG